MTDESSWLDSNLTSQAAELEPLGLTEHSLVNVGPVTTKSAFGLGGGKKELSVSKHVAQLPQTIGVSQNNVVRVPPCGKI